LGEQLLGSEKGRFSATSACECGSTGAPRDKLDVEWLTRLSYITETAPAKYRGTLAAFPQFMSVSGVCIGYFICYGSSRIHSVWAWRGPFAMQAVVASVHAASCLILPESPRWLVAHGQRLQAIRATQWLGISPAEAERDILRSDAEQNTSLSMWNGLALLFKKGYRTRTVLALFLLGMVQLSGIDGVLYVSRKDLGWTGHH
jgi:hypothetical protein